FGREPDGSPATHDDATRRAAALSARIFDAPEARATSLQELATNPLMLQILCLLFWDQGHLPEKRAELYEACVRTLLQLWRDAKRQRAAQRDLPMIGHQDALAVLQPLAWHLHQHNARELPEAKVIEAIAQPLQMRSELDLTPTAFLQQVRDQTGVLVSLGRGDYGFLHLSFQEYLAACHVQNSVADEPEIFDALAANFGDDWWREVILLSLGLTNPSLFGRLMAHLVRSKALSRDVLLASDCLRDAAEPSANALLQLLRSGIDDAGERYQVLRLLKSSRLGAWRDATVVGKETGRDVLRAIGRKEKSAEVRSLLSELLGEEITVSPSLGTKMRRAFARFLGVRPPGPDFAGSTVIGERVHEKDGSVLVYVPGGSYTLGGEAYSDEKPIHMVTLSPYWIGKYPVTNAQYGTFLEATKRGKPSRWNDKQFNGPDQPVVGVSWHDAQAYCAWAGLILPSEAQWEASARGTDQRTYPWGDGEPTKKLANYGKNVGRTTPVGSYPDGAGPFGMLDQAGNVWEWCVDVWSDDAYKGREGQEDPVNTVGDKTVRALRGGSWILVPR
ncbi:MAG: SUMF1/EgtB/PvdO family nonheme iron enzyme, partial [Acidobacteriota bacterium]